MAKEFITTNNLFLQNVKNNEMSNYLLGNLSNYYKFFDDFNFKYSLFHFFSFIMLFFVGYFQFSTQQSHKNSYIFWATVRKFMKFDTLIDF